MMKNLKPCPFCGIPATIIKTHRYPGKSNKGIIAFSIICIEPSCIIYRAEDKYYKFKRQAIDAWNRRT